MFSRIQKIVKMVKSIGSTAPSSLACLKTHSIDTFSDQPQPASTLFYCGHIPVSEHPAESNIRGAAIIDKNGCLVAEPADKTVAYVSMRPSISFLLFFIFLSFSLFVPDVPASRASAMFPRFVVMP